MIEQDLDTLSNYGEPTLFQGSTINGIYCMCSIDMRVNTKSISFNVKGKGRTAAQATALCVKNMQQAIADINNASIKSPMIGISQ
jgi:hypothetical protein